MHICDDRLFASIFQDTNDDDDELNNNNNKARKLPLSVLSIKTEKKNKEESSSI